MLSKLLQHPSNGFYILFASCFDIDKDVIKVHYHKNVELHYYDLVDIALKCRRCVGQSKRYDLILAVAMTGLESRLLFVAFLDTHLIVGIG